MTDEGFTLENIFIDGIGNQISNLTVNNHNEINALTQKKKIGLIQNSRIKTIKRSKKLSLKHSKNSSSHSKKEKSSNESNVIILTAEKFLWIETHLENM